MTFTRQNILGLTAFLATIFGLIYVTLPDEALETIWNGAPKPNNSPPSIKRHMQDVASQKGDELFEILGVRGSEQPNNWGTAFETIDEKTTAINLNLCVPQIGVSTDWVKLVTVYPDDPAAAGTGCGENVLARCLVVAPGYCQPLK